MALDQRGPDPEFPKPSIKEYSFKSYRDSNSGLGYIFTSASTYLYPYYLKVFSYSGTINGL